MKRAISVLIVDDEEKSRKVLCRLLQDSFPEVDIVGEAANVEEAYRMVNSIRPNLVFLDIQMPGGNGFWLLKQWEEIPFDIIFVTSFDQYAIEAIKYSALDYLLKPVEVHELRFAIEKAKKNMERRTNIQSKVVTLLNNLDPGAENKRIAVHMQDKVRFLNVKQICHIEAAGTYSKIKMVNNEQFITSKPLKYFQDLLSANGDFIRIHKSCFVNVIHIKEYTKGEICIISMVDGMQFEVARRKKQEVLERIKK
jgi:two-component system LytT family response regulator